MNENKVKVPGPENLQNSPAGARLQRNHVNIPFSLLASSGNFQTCFRGYEKALPELPWESQAPHLTHRHSPGTSHSDTLGNQKTFEGQANKQTNEGLTHMNPEGFLKEI